MTYDFLGPLTRFETPCGPIAYRKGGSGPAVLLLHGFPQTQAMWGHIAPRLAEQFTVVTADLRGYGDSFKPASVEDMSFRAMGADMLALMTELGVETFHLVGHDRGARTAHRMALDAAGRVNSLCVMDIVPTLRLLDQLSHPVARAYYHWFFLAQPHPFPETLIGHDPDHYFERCLLGFGKAQLTDFDPNHLAAYRAAWRDPAAIRAMCDDYRAAIDVDIVQDTADLDRCVTCPSLVLYGAEGAMAKSMDVPQTWKERLSDMQAAAIPGGHFFPDQSPEETVQSLLAFYAQMDV